MKRNRGVTLIEALVLIAVIGLVSVLLIPVVAPPAAQAAGGGDYGRGAETDPVAVAEAAVLRANLTTVSNLTVGLNSRSNAWDTGASAAGNATSAVATLQANLTTVSNLTVGLNGRSNAWDTAGTVAAGLNGRSNAWDTGASYVADTTPAATNVIVDAGGVTNTIVLNASARVLSWTQAGP
jgi:hypothetical protein